MSSELAVDMTDAGMQPLDAVLVLMLAVLDLGVHVLLRGVLVLAFPSCEADADLDCADAVDILESALEKQHIRGPRCLAAHLVRCLLPCSRVVHSQVCHNLPGAAGAAACQGGRLQVLVVRHQRRPRCPTSVPGSCCLPVFLLRISWFTSWRCYGAKVAARLLNSERPSLQYGMP